MSLLSHLKCLNYIKRGLRQAAATAQDAQQGQASNAPGHGTGAIDVLSSQQNSETFWLEALDLSDVPWDFYLAQCNST